MATRLKLTCDGCFEEVLTLPVRKKFESFSGRGHGFGVWKGPDIDDAVAPTGWVWSDPYTSCTYCPACWTSIEVGERDAEARQTMSQS
tara:strand:+ start:2009 stop:2272 length:264 start_codon:yes stop_codon:yes gene_type:complete